MLNLISVLLFSLFEWFFYVTLTLCQLDIEILLKGGLKSSITFRTLLCRVSELNCLTRGYYASL